MFMDQNTYIITFDNDSVADANRWASELKEVFLDAISDVEVEQRRDNPYSQDFGATLVLILGTPAIITGAKVLGNWLILHRQVSITIKTPQGEVVGTNLTSNDALKLAELLLAQHKEE
jgi:hypothetical protein